MRLVCDTCGAGGADNNCKGRKIKCHRCEGRMWPAINNRIIMKTEDKYYIEEVIQPKDGENMITIVLSVRGHGACIEIHGTNQVATERMLKVLKGLNEE